MCRAMSRLKTIPKKRLVDSLCHIECELCLNHSNAQKRSRIETDTAQTRTTTTTETKFKATGHTAAQRAGKWKQHAKQKCNRPERRKIETTKRNTDPIYRKPNAGRLKPHAGVNGFASDSMSFNRSSSRWSKNSSLLLQTLSLSSLQLRAMLCCTTQSH